MSVCSHNRSNPASGVVTVSSAKGPECHGASYYCAKCVKGSYRVGVNATILDFWVSQGVARTSCPRNNTCPEFAATGRCANGYHARDMVNADQAGRWFPFASRDTTGRADRVEFSHIKSSECGAYCACNLLPEVGAFNKARGAKNIPARDLSSNARALLAAWPAYWLANVARPASRKRVAA